MSATRSRAPLAVGAGVLALLVLAALIGGRGPSRVTSPQLSPRSVGADGTKALMLLLERFGAVLRYDEQVPSADTQVALLLRDRLDLESSHQLARWVAAGGRLIVTDPQSNLSARAAGSVATNDLVRGSCDAFDVPQASRLSVRYQTQEELVGANDVVYDVGRDTASCFGDGSTAYVVVAHKGKGSIVSIGGPTPFTNQSLARADNSLLAVDLLASRPGVTVAVLDPNPVGQGDSALIDLVPSRVVQAVLQLFVAFVVYVLWRSRRLGRPVTEPQSVEIAGSRLVDAVGRLHHRNGSVERAASDLRNDLHRALLESYGLPADAPAATLADVVAARTRLDRARVQAALADAPVTDEPSLVTLAHELDTIRQEVLDARR